MKYLSQDLVVRSGAGERRCDWSQKTHQIDRVIAQPPARPAVTVATGFVAVFSPIRRADPPLAPAVIDLLALQDSKQSVAAVEKLAAAVASLPDLYVLATFRLPPKLGGVLFGVYSRQDHRKYLEMAVMGKINKGWGCALPLWSNQTSWNIRNILSEPGNSDHSEFQQLCGSGSYPIFQNHFFFCCSFRNP